MSKPFIPTNEACCAYNGTITGRAARRASSKTPDPLAARLEQAREGAPIERHFWDLDENGELILN